LTPISPHDPVRTWIIAESWPTDVGESCLRVKFKRTWATRRPAHSLGFFTALDRFSSALTTTRLKECPMPIDKYKLAQVPAIASIASSLAIPVVLAVIGYFVQKQLADEGLKKDYVSIAVGILNSDPSSQEQDL